MSGAVAGMDLECRHCQHRWPSDAVVEAMLLHFQVDHDTDDVELDLRAICRCGAAMVHERTERESSSRDREHFRCPACGQTGTIRRRI